MTVFFYARYIDNIFITYTSGETKLNNFLTNQNMKYDLTKFDLENCTHLITFLVAVKYIDKNRQQLKLHTKPSNTHNYLH